MKVGANGIVVAQIMYAPTARAIVAGEPAGESMGARQDVIQTERLVVAQLHTIIRRHEPAHGGTTMTANGVVHLLDRIRSKQASLIQMKIAVAAREGMGESRTGGRKIFAHHLEAERLNDRDAGVFLRGEILVPVGVEKKFIQIDETNPIGASPAFLPAGFEKGKVRVE